MATTDTELEAFVAAFDDFVRAAKRARARARPDDPVTQSQYDLMLPLLDAPGPLRLGDLAAAVGISAPTATRMLDNLERRGLLTRARCADDRRAVRLALTDAGADIMRERRARTLSVRRALFGTLDPSERRMAAQVLERLATAFDEVEG